MAYEPSIYHRTAALSARLCQHSFTTLYHAVALEHVATLITADRNEFNKARHWVGNRAPRTLSCGVTMNRSL